MKKTILRFVIASCTVAMLPVAAQAQVRQPQPPVTQPPVTPQQQAVPLQRPGVTQDRPGTTRPAQARMSSQQDEQKLEQLVAAQLLIANRGVIELSKMAVEKADHDKVKQFAQTLVKDHESLCREIEKLQAAKGYSDQDGHSQADKTPGDRAPGDRAAAAQVRQPGQPGQPRQPGQPATRRGETAQADTDGIVGKLTTIAEKSSKKQLEMTKEMLQQLEGKDFDMAFVGIQIAAHTRAVADLNALRGVGSPEMQELVNKAESKTSEHLKKAKDLAEELSS